MLEKIKKLPLWGKILMGVGTGLVVIVIGIAVYGNYLYSKMNVETPEEVAIHEEVFDEDDIDESIPETNEEEVVFETPLEQKNSKEVINILFAGEEAINSGDARGRTDSIMIGTLNKRDGNLKLTSIMRDSYVQIPRHSANKINAAYAIGGMPLLVETIESNFGITLDGYILVGFDKFEQIIDYLGGIQITLSSAEASYLNRKDYITHSWNRNLYAGTMTLNGDQALGYARVRYVDKGDQSGDFGRTERHRDVLNAIYEKFKGQSLVQMLQVLPDLFGLVTTDLSRSQVIDYLTDFAMLNSTEIETMRIPIEDGYRMTRINKMSVVIPDFPMNIEAMRGFIFGSVVVENTEEAVNEAIAENSPQPAEP